MFEQQQKLFFHEIWTEIVNNQERTNQITADIETELKQNRYPLIISERKDHISHLSRSLKSKKLKIDLSSRPSELSCADYYKLTEYFERIK